MYILQSIDMHLWFAWLKLKNFAYLLGILGVSVAEFFEIIQEKTNLDADCSEAFFGQMLLAVTEFDVFMVMMKEAAQAKTPYDPDAAAAMLTPSDESKSDPIVTNISDAKADSKWFFATVAAICCVLSLII